MTDAFTFLIAGGIFGLAGGFSPGPTTTVVVSQTLRFGVMDGIKVAIAPALTDAPIILVAVLLVGQLAKFEFADKRAKNGREGWEMALSPSFASVRYLVGLRWAGGSWGVQTTPNLIRCPEAPVS